MSAFNSLLRKRSKFKILYNRTRTHFRNVKKLFDVCRKKFVNKNKNDSKSSINL